MLNSNRQKLQEKRMMRVKDLFYTIVISTITSLIVTGILITGRVLQTPQPPRTYQIKQIIENEFSIQGEDRSKTFQYPIENITGAAVTRIIHIYVEFNVTANPEHIGVSIQLELFDTNLQRRVGDEHSELHMDYGLMTMLVSVNVDHAYFLQITVYGSKVVGFIQGTIIQDVAV